MSTVKLSLGSMSKAQKIQFTRRVAAAMAAHEELFPEPPVGPDQLQDVALALEEVYNDAAVARDQARMMASQTDAREAIVDDRLNRVARYVQSVSTGDEGIIRLAGMEVRELAAPVGPLPAPEGLVVSPGMGSGAVAGRWRPVRGAMSYQVQGREVGGAGDWLPLGVSTRASLVMSGLRSGTRYAFRVSALGAAGQGPWSSLVEWVVG